MLSLTFSCGNCLDTGADHRGRYCECPAGMAIRPSLSHVHSYSFENLSRGYETHSCACGSTIRFHVKE